MKYQQKLEEYQTILQKNEPTAVFNWGAFIFNSFYYLWKDISIGKFFIYFLATPLLILSFGQAQINPEAALLIPILIVRIIAGFRANIDIKIRMQKFVDFYKKNGTEPEPVVYFSVSPIRLFFLSIITLGIYDIYWIYKNWQAVRKYEKDYEITPFFRSWLFGVFFIYPLFSRMKKSFQKTISVNKTFSVCALLYTLFYFISLFPSKEIDEISWLDYLRYILLPLSALLLLPIQGAINRHNQKLNPNNKPSSKLSLGEILVIVFSLALSSLSFYAGYTESDNDLKQKEFITYVYINENIYPQICKKHGYELKRYQNIFRKAAAERIKKIKNIEKELQQIDQLYGEETFRRFEKNMSEANKNGVSQNQSENIILTCQEMDKFAEEIITYQLNNTKF